MEKFSFDKWKNGARVITGYGREVKDLTYLPNADKDRCLVGVVEGEIQAWSYNGVYNTAKDYQLGSSWDLCHPEEQLYINLYKHPSGVYIAGDVSDELKKPLEYIPSEEYVGTYKLVKI